MPRLPLRHALALAAAAVVATPAAAQSSLTLYGLIDLSVGGTQAPGANSVAIDTSACARSARSRCHGRTIGIPRSSVRRTNPVRAWN